MTRIVLDTNVLVSALLLQGSVPDQVLGTVLAGRSRLIVDGRIMAEYRAVLTRRAFGFEPHRVEELLDFLAQSEWVVPDPLPLRLPDPSDLPFLEVAIVAGADALVTGNPRHFTAAARGLDLPVLTPRQYIAHLSAA